MQRFQDMPLFPDKPYDVFLSHGHVDVEVVVKIAERLEDEAGARVWLDRWGAYSRATLAAGDGEGT
jgi:hypothetical protein